MLQMKTACQQCANLTRQLQDAAKEELQLYNNYFVDILFRSMQPRQQVRRVTKWGPCVACSRVATWRPGHLLNDGGEVERTVMTLPRKQLMLHRMSPKLHWPVSGADISGRVRNATHARLNACPRMLFVTWHPC